MPDIFISYSSKDKKLVRKIAIALEQSGLEVWWDPEIKPGQAYRQIIQDALDNSDCVLVIWSNTSVKSVWVQAEATQAFEENKLIPISIGCPRIPMPFNSIQTASLDKWGGDTIDERFQNVISGITVHCNNRNILSISKKQDDNKIEEQIPGSGKSIAYIDYTSKKIINNKSRLKIIYIKGVKIKFFEPNNNLILWLLKFKFDHIIK